jgi:hypothetical protein
MSGLEIQSTGELISSCNGKIIEDAKWNMDYDGNTMNIETVYNDEMSLIQLDNNDLHRLFGNIGSNKNSMEERLKRDFNKKKYSSPTTKRVRFTDKHLRKSGKHKIPIVIKSSLKRSNSPKRSSSKSKQSSTKSKGTKSKGTKSKGTKRKKSSTSKKRTKRNSIENTIY